MTDTREKLVELLIDSPSLFCSDEEFAETAERRMIMREILFRAKTEPNCKDVMNGKIIKNPKWIYGYVDLGYMHDCKAPLIGDKKGNKIYKCQYETIGQFTGLTDRNGKKIFEGDIVRDAQSSLFGKVIYATPQDGFDGIAGFMVDDIDDGFQNYNGFWHQVEVVGNIHDNPELLGVTDNA